MIGGLFLLTNTIIQNTLTSTKPAPTPTNVLIPVGGKMTNTVIGEIRWNDQPIAGINVELTPERCGNKSISETVTDNLGSFTFDGISSGKYVVSVNGFGNGKKNPTYESSCYSWAFTLEFGNVSEQNRNLSKLDLILLSPTLNEKMPKQPTITWQPYTDSAWYTVTLVQRTPTFQQEFSDLKTTNTSLTLPRQLGDGLRYDGWVMAYNSRGTPIAITFIPLFIISGN